MEEQNQKDFQDKQRRQVDERPKAPQNGSDKQ